MSSLVKKIKKEMNIVGKDVFKEAVAECIKQRAEWRLRERLRAYADSDTNYVNGLHTWSESLKGRDFWNRISDKVGVEF